MDAHGWTWMDMDGHGWMGMDRRAWGGMSVDLGGREIIVIDGNATEDTGGHG